MKDKRQSIWSWFIIFFWIIGFVIIPVIFSSEANRKEKHCCMFTIETIMPSTTLNTTFVFQCKHNIRFSESEDGPIVFILGDSISTCY